MTELEEKIFKETKKYLRLSAERDLYTIPQAAHRLNESRNDFINNYIMTGRIKLTLVRGKRLVARSEIERFIDEQEKVIHKNGLRASNF